MERTPGALMGFAVASMRGQRVTTLFRGQDPLDLMTSCGPTWRSFAALLLVLPLLAGCLDPTPETGDGGQVDEPWTIQVPEADLDRVADYHADFSQGFPWRHTGSPTNWLASQALIEDLEAAGWEAKLITYLPPGDRAPAPIADSVLADAGINVVIGIKPGDEPGILGWVSHYDVVPQTIEGAYDDGSGVAVGIELAHMFADYDNKKTLMAIFFDSEEIGLVASDYFVQDVVRDDLAAWHLVIGHDMVGINWPGHDWAMYQMVGEPHVDQIEPVQERLYREILDYPEEGVTVLPVHDRNSDERRFKDEGAPIIRMAGGRHAADYPEYHLPQDTVDYILDFVGGRENWKAGLGTVLEATAYNIVLFDNLPHPEDETFPEQAAWLLDRFPPVERS